MPVGKPEAIAPETAAHRIGGGSVENLRLKPREQTLTPPGLSVLLEGTPRAAAEQMRRAFPDPRQFARLHAEAEVVGSTTAQAIRQTGFDVVPAPTSKFPNHARLTHPEGTAGFTDANLQELSRVFQNTPTPRC